MEGLDKKPNSMKWVFMIVLVVAVVIIVILAFYFFGGGTSSSNNSGKEEELKVLYEAIPFSSTHSLIQCCPDRTTGTEDVLQKINNSEGNYLDENFYVHIPGGDHENVNSHDSLEIKFQIPPDFIGEENELFVKVKLACGDYGEIFIKSSNKFGDFDNLERVKCETENWEEKEIVVSSGSVWTEDPVIILKRDGGVGQVKIDSVEIFVKG